MSLTVAFHESLPYIDPEPTPEERAAAEALIASSLSEESGTPPHPRLPALRDPNFSPLIQAELERVASSTPLAAIDLTRYEAQEPSASSGTPTTSEEALRRSYTAHAYLSTRNTNLQLLEQYGKNAWLVGNFQLEGELASLERELEKTKRDIDLLTVERRRVQDEVAGEMRGLEEAWRKGVGRALETEVAAGELKRDVLEQMRLRGGPVAGS